MSERRGLSWRWEEERRYGRKGECRGLGGGVVGLFSISPTSLLGHRAGWPGAGASARPAHARSGAASAGVECQPGQIVGHLDDQPADRPGDVLATVTAVAAELAVEKERQQVVGGEEEPEERADGVGVVGEDVAEAPEGRPLVEARVLDVPAGADDGEDLLAPRVAAAARR